MSKRIVITEGAGFVGHHFVDSSKLVASGYTYPKALDESLRRTVEWEIARMK